MLVHHVLDSGIRDVNDTEHIRMDRRYTKLLSTDDSLSNLLSIPMSIVHRLIVRTITGSTTVNLRINTTILKAIHDVVDGSNVFTTEPISHHVFKLVGLEHIKKCLREHTMCTLMERRSNENVKLLGVRLSRDHDILTIGVAVITIVEHNNDLIIIRKNTNEVTNSATDGSKTRRLSKVNRSSTTTTNTINLDLGLLRLFVVEVIIRIVIHPIRGPRLRLDHLGLALIRNLVTNVPPGDLVVVHMI